jgi:hypothetical protein
VLDLGLKRASEKEMGLRRADNEMNTHRARNAALSHQISIPWVGHFNFCGESPSQFIIWTALALTFVRHPFQ